MRICKNFFSRDVAGPVVKSLGCSLIIGNRNSVACLIQDSPSPACLAAGRHLIVDSCRIVGLDLVGTCCGSCQSTLGWPSDSSADSPCLSVAASAVAASGSGVAAAVRTRPKPGIATAAMAVVEEAATFDLVSSFHMMESGDVPMLMPCS